MKLPTLRRNTQADLAKVQADIEAREARLAELGKRHEAALESDDGIDQARALMREMDDECDNLAVLQDRREKLETRLVSEQAAQSEADYKAWAARVEATLPACRAADEKYERAKIALAAATKEVILSRENTRRVYSEGELQPQTVFADYYLSLEPLGHDILETWQIPRGHADRRPPSPSEYLTRGANADQRRGYAPAMRSRLDEFALAVKTAHDPPPVETETNQDEEAAA